MINVSGSICNISHSQLLDLYREKGIKLGRYLRGDYYIKIEEEDRTIHISDFAGTKSAGFMPRNTTMVVKDNQPVEMFETYGARNVYESNGMVRVDRDHITRKTYDSFFAAIDKAVRIRTSDSTTLLLSGGIDSGTIAASLNHMDISYTALSSVVNEDTNVVTQRHDLAPSSRVIPPSSAEHLTNHIKNNTTISELDGLCGLSHYAAALEIDSGSIVLSGLGVDELYSLDGPDEHLLRDFIRTSSIVYDEFNIDIRYPLLDYNVWLEYTRLSYGLRNSPKKPFIKYMRFKGYPLQDKIKHPFIPWKQ